MVVIRKQPVAPAQPMSRTSSSQTIPSRRPTTKQTNGVNPKPKKDNSKRPLSPTSRKPVIKPLKPPHRKRTSLIDRIFLFLLAFFAIYAATVCRTHSPVTPESSLICRSLSTYRTAILEPYVLPPLKAIITHPSVQQTYHSRVQPYLHAAQPYLSSAVKAEARVRPYLVRVYASTQSAIERTWNGILKPYYTKAVLPRYRLYVLPHIKKIIKPFEAWYRAVVYPYLLQIQGLYETTRNSVQELYLISIQPYAGKAWSTTRAALCNTYKKARPHLVTAYTYSMKTGCIVWNKSRPVLCATWKQATVYLKYGLHEFGNARRTYVDPHLRRIWEKVSPESTESQVVVSVPPTTDERITKIEEYPDTVEAETAESLVKPTHSTPSSISSPAPTLISAQTATKSEAAPEQTPLDEVANAPVHATPIPEEEAAISIAKASAGSPDPSGPAAELENEVTQSVLASVAKDEITATASPTPVAFSEVTKTPPPSPIVDEEASHVEEEEASPAEAEETPALAPPIPEDESVTASHSTVVPEKHDDLLSASSIIHASAHGVVPTVAAFEMKNAEEEIDDFLREIGIHDGEGRHEREQEPISASQDQPEQPHQPTPEEIAAKAAQVAAKRAEIVSRHKKWQNELDALVSSKETDLRTVITLIRNAAVLELNSLSGEAKHGKGILGGVQTEGERLVKGVEAYLRGAEGRSGAWKLVGEEGKDKERKGEKQLKAQGEMVKFSQVLERVEGRFEEAVRGVQGEVHEWYVSVRDKEVGEVVEAAAEVKLFADKAQADIGLDYAWLDDVTYDDWQEYHDLMRTSDKFEQTARQVQNNTHPTTPTPDPLLPVLDKLQEELGDVVLGFQVALGGPKSRAREVFSVYDLEDESSGFFSIKHGEKEEGRRVDDMRGVLNEQEEEEVRILPIEPSPPVPGKPADSEEVVVDMADVLVGKSAEQIERDLKDIPLVQVHEEL